jgi:hypothetical protein
MYIVYEPTYIENFVTICSNITTLNYDSACELLVRFVDSAPDAVFNVEALVEWEPRALWHPERGGQQLREDRLPMLEPNQGRILQMNLALVIVTLFIQNY